MIRLRIGVDWDDVVAPFNSIACQMANEKYQIEPPLTIQDVTWGNYGRDKVTKEFHLNEELYRRQSQSVTEDVKDCIRELEKIADVYFITAVYPEFMGVRAKQIRDEFPELGCDRIILGAAKHLVTFDIILDDNINNVLNSPSKYPVLFRKPWNKDMTGLLSVTKMEDFLVLVKHIMREEEEEVKKDVPRVFALVGPSGSNKNNVAHGLCACGDFKRPKTYTTKTTDETDLIEKTARFIDEECFEQTMYGGYKYGCRIEDINKVLNSGKNAVLPLDMCGAVALKKVFPTTIVFLKRNKQAVVLDIVSDENMTPEEKTLRLLSLDAERRNESLCDIVADANQPVMAIVDYIRAASFGGR